MNKSTTPAKTTTKSRRNMKRPEAFYKKDEGTLPTPEPKEAPKSTIKITSTSSRQAEAKTRQKTIAKSTPAPKKHQIKVSVSLDNSSDLEKEITKKAENDAKKEAEKKLKAKMEAETKAAEEAAKEAKRLAEEKAEAEAAAAKKAAEEAAKAAIIAKAEKEAKKASTKKESTKSTAVATKKSSKKKVVKIVPTDAEAVSIIESSPKPLPATIAEPDKETIALSKTIAKAHRAKMNRKFALAFACAAICIAALGYFVSLNIPNISVKVTAMQAGIDAVYPTYIPKDYQLSSVSSEKEGTITMVFNGPNKVNFSITEEKSSWDSSALLNNFVKPTWEDEYDIIREQGLTIYVSGSKATWVNGGMLYKITDDSGALTKKQIKNIAISI